MFPMAAVEGKRRVGGGADVKKQQCAVSPRVKKRREVKPIIVAVNARNTEECVYHLQSHARNKQTHPHILFFSPGGRQQQHCRCQTLNYDKKLKDDNEVKIYGHPDAGRFGLLKRYYSEIQPWMPPLGRYFRPRPFSIFSRLRMADELMCSNSESQRMKMTFTSGFMSSMKRNWFTS